MIGRREKSIPENEKAMILRWESKKKPILGRSISINLGQIER